MRAVKNLQGGWVMVALFVALMFVGFVLVDLIVRKIEVRRAEVAIAARARAAVTAAVPAPLWQVPQGVYLSQEHAWFKPDPSGGLRVGADALVVHAVGAVEHVVLPKAGEEVKAGQALFRLHRNGYTLTIPSTVTGRVVSVNDRLRDNPQLLASDPYGAGWVCSLSPTRADGSAASTRIGEKAAVWLETEFARFREFIWAQIAPDFALGTTSQDGGLPAAGALIEFDPAVWRAFEAEFLHSG